MPNYRRVKIKAAAYFFTVNTFRRRPLLTIPTVLASLREAVSSVRKEHPFKVEGWVVLPDHMHCIWVLPAGDADFSLRWSLIKQSVSKRCAFLAGKSALSESRLKRREIAFWQRRFWEHLIRDDADYVRHMDYMHWNPVKHGFVTRVIDWPYSTFHKLVRQGVYPPCWGCNTDAFGTSSFGE